jgi:hypothetical protein
MERAAPQCSCHSNPALESFKRWKALSPAEKAHLKLRAEKACQKLRADGRRAQQSYAYAYAHRLRTLQLHDHYLRRS